MEDYRVGLKTHKASSSSHHIACRRIPRGILVQVPWSLRATSRLLNRLLKHPVYERHYRLRFDFLFPPPRKHQFLPIVHPGGDCFGVGHDILDGVRFYHTLYSLEGCEPRQFWSHVGERLMCIDSFLHMRLGFMTC